MVSGNRTRSVTQGPYYPAALTPEFMSAHPPISYNSSHDSASQRVSYFQNYRNEIISKFTIPPYDWSIQKSPYSPQPDLAAAKRIRTFNRLLAFPVNNITTIDAGRMQEIDDMYLASQHQREQYKDRTGLLHPLKYFKPDEYNFQSPSSLLPSYLFKYTESYPAYKIPTVLPLTYEKTIKTPYLPELAVPGIYDRGNCIAYKL